MCADVKSAQPGLIRSWTHCLVRRASEGLMVETPIMESVVNAIHNRTTTCDPGYLLRLRKYVRNSGCLNDPRNWEQFQQDVWAIVCELRSSLDEVRSNLREVVGVPTPGYPVDLFSVDARLRHAFLTARVGDTVDGWTKTNVGWR